MKSSLPHFWESSDFWKKLFGFDHSLVEEKVTDQTGLYKNLSLNALYTSYEDLFFLMTSPWASGTWVDLGAGVGVSALMYGYIFPDREAYALEISQARVDEGKKVQERLKLNHVHIQNADLLTALIPEGETFFLYFPTGMVLDRVLFELYERKKPFTLIAIESHGDLFPRLIKEPWLKKEASLPLKSLRHHPDAFVFKTDFTRPVPKLSPHHLSFKPFFLTVKNNEEEWLGESYGMVWDKDETWTLSLPPRTIQWNQVQKVSSELDLSSLEQFVLSLRRLGVVKITTHEQNYEGNIRKIMIRPTFALEISSGEKVEWKEILTITWEKFLCYDSLSAHFSLPLAPWGQ